MKTRRITPETWTYSTPDGGILPNRAYSGWGWDLGVKALIPPGECSSLCDQLFILRNDLHAPLWFSLVDITWRESQALLGG